MDGVDVWGLHTASTAAARSNVSAAHESLWLSAEVLLQGDYKLVVAQQEPKKTNNPPIYGWKCNSPQLNSTPSARCDTHNSSAEPYEEERAPPYNYIQCVALLTFTLGNEVFRRSH